jgi:hypothetical protein
MPIGDHDRPATGELERPDHPPLRWVDAEMIADLQRLLHPDKLDRTGKPHQHCE